ncbi:MAG: efflux RND transporter periplasmic adaptor subunit, partial [Nitrospira sp.]|nr:efflux RND transporter periplasmic adaptor subunit [Nitrospira sp.]
LLGLTEEQVEYIEGLDEPNLTLTIPSPDTGTVTEKLAHVGMYVKQGQPVFRITDLTRLWLMVDVHERDLSWVSLGQKVEVVPTSYATKKLTGTVGFINPELDPRTRTVKVRVEVDNPQGLLKPKMYARATIYADLDRNGELAAPELKGGYACPMHPLLRHDSKDDDCEICGMDLVPVEAQKGRKPGKVWAIPREAVLNSGLRTLVAVEWRKGQTANQDDSGTPVWEALPLPEYELLELELGPVAVEYHVDEKGIRHKLGEYYPLIAGYPTQVEKDALAIVTKGQFLIDSQMELTGKPSLIRSGGGEAADPHAGH